MHRYERRMPCKSGGAAKTVRNELSRSHKPARRKAGYRVQWPAPVCECLHIAILCSAFDLYVCVGCPMVAMQPPDNAVSAVVLDTNRSSGVVSTHIAQLCEGRPCHGLNNSEFTAV